MFDKLMKNKNIEDNNFKEELNLSSFFKFLNLKRKTLFKIVGVIVVVVLIYSLIAPFQYRSGATILPPENSGGMGDLTSFLQTLSGGISFGGAAQGNRLLVFKDILKSRESAKIIVDKNNLIKRLKVKPDEVDDLYDGIANMLNVELKRSGLIIVTAETSTPFLPSSEDKKRQPNFLL